jgi:hypothetical protein
MSVPADPRTAQYQMNFRKGRFLVLVSGPSQELIHRFAQLVLVAISN